MPCITSPTTNSTRLFRHRTMPDSRRHGRRSPAKGGCSTTTCSANISPPGRSYALVRVSVCLPATFRIVAGVAGAARARQRADRCACWINDAKAPLRVSCTGDATIRRQWSSCAFSSPTALGEDQSQTDRRVRELRRYFDIEAVRARQRAAATSCGAGRRHGPPTRASLSASGAAPKCSRHSGARSVAGRRWKIMSNSW